MSATASRWWAPAEPGLDLDQTGRTLLTPVGDAHTDLTGALLALHRAGEAACLSAAAAPLPDRRGLATALATVRERAAGPVVDAVSKSLDEASYAGLLVRDVADDAEAACLSVYDRAVANGIPPAMAMRRAGMVYGTPARELGKFTTLACELRAHPEALAHEADTALFGAVTKYVSDEQPREEVTKAPQQASSATAAATRDWHGRDPGERDPATGQFQAAGGRPSSVAPSAPRRSSAMSQLRARLGMDRPAPQVDTPTETKHPEPEPEKPTPAQPRQPRKPQRVRNKKIVRTAPKVAEPPKGTQDKVSRDKVEREKVARDMVARTKISRTVAERLKIAPRKVNRENLDTRPAVDFDDPLALRPDAGVDYGQLGEEVAIVVDGDVGHELLNRIRGSTSQFDDQLVRMGYVVDAAGGHSAVETGGSESHDRALEAAANRIDPYGDPPRVEAVDVSEFVGLDEKQKQARMTEIARRLVARQMVDPRTGQVRETVHRDDLDQVSMTVSPDTREVIFTFEEPPPSGVKETGVDRIYEFVVHGAQGLNMGQGVHTDYTLDPNQAYELVRDRQGNLERTWYDYDLGTWRVRVTLRPVDEEVVDEVLGERQRRREMRERNMSEMNAGRDPYAGGWRSRLGKADTSRSATATATRDWHGQDPGERDPATGQFQATAGRPSAPAPTTQRRSAAMAQLRARLDPQTIEPEHPAPMKPRPQTPRKPKRVSNQRVVRTIKPKRVSTSSPSTSQRATVSREKVARAKVARAKAVRERLGAGQSFAAHTKPQVVEVAPSSLVHVLGGYELDEMRELGGLFPGESMVMRPDSAVRGVIGGAVAGSAFAMGDALHAIAETDNLKSPAGMDVVATLQVDLDNEASLLDAAQQMGRLLDENPDYHLLHPTYVGGESDTSMTRTYQVMANSRPLRPAGVVEVADDVDLFTETPLVLEYVGRYTSREVGIASDDFSPEAALGYAVDLPVDLFRVRRQG